jgi:hypothetical protein
MFFPTLGRAIRVVRIATQREGRAAMKLSSLLIGVGIGVAAASYHYLDEARGMLASILASGSTSYSGSGNKVFDRAHDDHVRRVNQEPRDFAIYRCMKRYDADTLEVQDFAKSRGWQVDPPSKSEVCPPDT